MDGKHTIEPEGCAVNLVDKNGTTQGNLNSPIVHNHEDDRLPKF